MSSYNVAAATELCLRSAVETAGIPFSLSVGDSGSSDGSVAMLRSFEAAGLLDLDVDSEGRHWKWLDKWHHSCPERYAVFIDADIVFLRHGWLDQLVKVAHEHRAALVCGEMLDEHANAVEPVGRKTVRLACRPSLWMLLIDTEQTRSLGADFAYDVVETDAVPEGVILYDCGGSFYRDLVAAGLAWTAMPPSFLESYHHFAGLSWRKKGFRQRGKAWRVKRLLKNHRARQSAGVPHPGTGAPVPLHPGDAPA